MDDVVGELRKKYGCGALRRATVLQDERFCEMNLKDEHIIRPAGIEDGC